MYMLWKRKKWILVALIIILSGAAAESVWGLSSLWKVSAQKEIIIVVDAGHGGIDPGAVTEMAVEKDLNLQIAQKLQGYLEEAGYLVTMTRWEDAGLYEAEDTNKKRADMQKRSEIIEESEAALMISIHQNAYPDSQYWGPQVFFQKQSPESAAFGLLVQEALNTFTAPENTREAKANDSYYILQHSSMPAILVECGFITNSQDAENLQDETYQKKVAWAIYCGIEKYLQSGGV